MSSESSQSTSQMSEFEACQDMGCLAPMDPFHHPVHPESWLEQTSENSNCACNDVRTHNLIVWIQGIQILKLGTN